MKKILLLITLSLLSLSAMAQGGSGFEKNNEIIEQFISSYKNSKSVTTIKIGKTMTEAMAVKLFENKNHESAKLMQSIESIDILTEDCKQGSDALTAIFDLPQRCKGFELITSIEEDGNINRFYFASHKDSEMCEFLMINRRDNERTLLYITGSFSITDISALSSVGNGMK